MTNITLGPRRGIIQNFGRLKEEKQFAYILVHSMFCTNYLDNVPGVACCIYFSYFSRLTPSGGRQAFMTEPLGCTQVVSKGGNRFLSNKPGQSQGFSEGSAERSNSLPAEIGHGVSCPETNTVRTRLHADAERVFQPQFASTHRIRLCTSHIPRVGESYEPHPPLIPAVCVLVHPALPATQVQSHAGCPSHTAVA